VLSEVHVVTRGAVAVAIVVAGLAMTTPVQSQGKARQPRPSAAAAPPSAAPSSPRRIAVLGFDALGMDDEKVARLEALFRMELERLAGGPGPSRRDIAGSLRGTRLARCTGETACLAAIGKRLGVALVVSGNVAALGDSYVVNIKVVDAASAAELRRIASDPLRGNPDELIDSVRVAAYRLLAPERLLGAISVLADIAGAQVVLDGRAVGSTPLPGPIERLRLGPHRLEVRAPGFSTFAETVQVRFQKTTRVLVRLVVDPGAGQVRRVPRTPRPAPERWYQSPWFLVGAGVAAVVVGGVVGFSLAGGDVLDCGVTPEACR
jgi:TolB-like protein